MASTGKVCPVCQQKLSEQELQFGFCSIEHEEKFRDVLWRLSEHAAQTSACLRELIARRRRFLKRRDTILSELRFLGNEWTKHENEPTRTLLETDEKLVGKAWLRADERAEVLSDAIETTLKRYNELTSELALKSKVLEG